MISPMLFIHTSNQLEQLKNQYASVVSTPLNSVFSTELVIVQNAGMARWLSMEMANISGISANTEFLFPAEFMWKLLRLVSTDIPEQSQCTTETLRFHILQEITQHPDHYPEIQHYILSDGNINQLASWELAVELSQLLDQYLFYRSAWIRDWEKESWDSSQNWQSRLWQRCVKDKGLIHWLSLQDQFKQSLVDINTEKLPQRISFFSMSALSPGYLDLLGELAHQTEIHLYIINPCEDAYWGDIQSEKSRAKLNSEVQTYTEVGNPLLASMGKQGREFISKLLQLANVEHQSIDSPQDTNKESLLNQLQQDIYNLEQPKRLDHLSKQDHSIQFNACHTAMREVEVLYDNILAELDTNADLAPSDIVVMMPDIESYAPYIEAVFSSAEQNLPFSIADRDPQNVSKLIEALNKIFKLPELRFDVESVFEILEYEDIRSQFNLDELQVSYCRELAHATNLRWGISAETRNDNNLPETDEHTWKYAMDRMLLGYAIGESVQSEQLYDAKRNLPLLPYNEIEGSDAIVLSNFKRFTDTLFSINHWQKLECTLNKWLEKSKRLIKQTTLENTDQQQLLNAMAELDSQANLANFQQTLTFSVYQKMLQQCLQNITGNEKYLGYGITFCALVPMRSVPFKIVALLGMNDGEFPRQDKRPSFDLMANQRQAGDRSRRDEDRYLFLESILATRSKLLISYIGQSVKDNTELPPSVLVSELLESITDYSGISAEQLIVKHPLHAFSPRYFSNEQDAGKSSLFSYAHEYTQLNKTKESVPKVFIKEPLDDLDESFKTLTLNDLIRFYKSPARAFLKHRFDIQTLEEDDSLKVREPFELESFKQSEIRSFIQECGNNSNDDAQLIARAKGLLPYGQIGDEIYQKEKLITETFVSQLPIIEFHPTKQFLLEINDFQLHGKLEQLSTDGRFVQQLTNPYASDYISLWLNHLVLNAENGDQSLTTTFYSPDLAFTLRPVENAKEQLLSLLNYYWQGLSYPLEFFPRTSLELFAGNGTENTAKISAKWNGNDLYSGERDKFENWLLHRNLDINKNNPPEQFLEISRYFFGMLFEHLTEEL